MDDGGVSVQRTSSLSVRQPLRQILILSGISATVLAIAMVAGRIAIELRQSLGAAAPTVAAVAFLCLVHITLSSRGSESIPFRNVARDVAIGAVVALLLIDRKIVYEAHGAFTYAAWFFAPAAVEEIVFRQQLQQRFGDSLRSFFVDDHTRYVVAAVLAGLTFAASHYVLLRSPLSAGAMTNFARLFALALVMTLLVRFAGLGVAIGSHAAFNAYSLQRVPWSTVQPSAMAIVLAIAGALVFLKHAGPIRRGCDESGAGTFQNGGRMSLTGKWRGSLVALLVASSGAIFACGQGAGDLLTRPSQSTSGANKAEAPAEVGAIASNPEYRAKYLAARSSAKPLIAVHHDAMKDLRENFNAWHASVRGAANPTCAIASALTSKYAARMGRGSGLSDADVESAMSLGQQYTKGCEGADPASLFSTTRPRASVRTDSYYIGPFLYLYNDVTMATINAWDGISDLAADVDAAVQNMPYQYPLTNEDMEYLGALVEFAISSHNDAQAVSWTDNPNDTYEIGSLFATAAWPGLTFLKRVAFVILSDVGAFASAFLIHDGNDSEEDGIDDSLMVGSGAGIGASVTATIQCLADATPCSAIH